MSVGFCLRLMGGGSVIMVWYGMVWYIDAIRHMIDLFFVCASFCEWRFHMFYLSLVLLDDNREA